MVVREEGLEKGAGNWETDVLSVGDGCSRV